MGRKEEGKTAIIIGAGPAGLTAAYELLIKTKIKPIVLEMSSDVGGISKTINYKGNYIDIGGHRFFSKSDRVMKWWTDMIPVETKETKNNTDLIMLIRSRISRIFYLKSFFDYPISFSFQTLKNIGLLKTIKIVLSYSRAVLFPLKNEQTLEDFMINRFGKELYLIFFKDYTEKVWGTECSNISAEWGAQRIKGLSIMKTLYHSLKKIIKSDKSISQKKTETSLIEQFIYPKYGPGQMWQETANKILAMGGEIHMQQEVKSILLQDDNVASVTVKDFLKNTDKVYKANYFFSTMPVRDLVNSFFGTSIPKAVVDTAKGLVYRDFITVGLLLKKLSVKTKNNPKVQQMITDNWIYIQDKEVKVGRVQIFNNWSPDMVKDKNNVWIGLEYFCNEGDELWEKDKDTFIAFAIDELQRINFIKKEDVVDATHIRVAKTYPAYFGTYNKFKTIRNFTDSLENLFLIGRNGMHKYNNQDHSMLTAMAAVDNVSKGITNKENIWNINTEQDYHEYKNIN